MNDFLNAWMNEKGWTNLHAQLNARNALMNACIMVEGMHNWMNDLNNEMSPDWMIAWQYAWLVYYVGQGQPVLRDGVHPGGGPHVPPHQVRDIQRTTRQVSYISVRKRRRKIRCFFYNAVIPSERMKKTFRFDVRPE